MLDLFPVFFEVAVEVGAVVQVVALVASGLGGFFEGEEFAVDEITSVEFGVTLPPDILVIEVPEGTKKRRHRRFRWGRWGG